MSDFELIVVDDGSDEDYGHLKRLYLEGRVQWVRLDRNSGQSAARNAGAERARAGMIAFIDQDDRWYPDRLEIALKLRGDSVMTYSDLDEIDENGSIMFRRVLELRQPGRHPWKSLPDVLAQDSLVLPGTCLFDKKVFFKIGGFDPQLSGYEDDDLFLRVFQMGPIRFIPKALMQYRVYAESYRCSDRIDLSRRLYFEKLVLAFPDDDSGRRPWVREKIAPRFSGLWLTRVRDSLRRKEPGIYRIARTQLRRTSLHGGLRLKVGGGLLSVIPYSIARIIYRIPRFKYLATILFSMRSRPHKSVGHAVQQK
jgi:glycosyltransferase involved in cell wall biosynthesis